MTLQEYLGPKIFDDIRNKAVEDSSEFMKQTGSTKLALADNLKVENSMLKQGVHHLINVIDDAGAEIELLEKRNQYYQKTFGDINKEYLNKPELSVTKTADKSHAKRLLIKYVQKYENENNIEDHRKIQPKK